MRSSRLTDAGAAIRLAPWGLTGAIRARETGFLYGRHWYRPTSAQLGRENSPRTNPSSRSMRLVPRTFDDQRLALGHGTPPYLDWHTRELGPPGV
jgi:hypothetical protein